MADIHVGKISELCLDVGLLQLIYHIPLDSPVSGIVPTPISIIDSSISQTEKDRLAAGTLVEIVKDMKVTSADSPAIIANAVKVDWRNVMTEYNRQFNFEHRFYGIAINATS